MMNGFSDKIREIWSYKFSHNDYCNRLSRSSDHGKIYRKKKFLLMILLISFISIDPVLSRDMYQWRDPETGHLKLGDIPPNGIKYDVVREDPPVKSSKRAPSNYSDLLVARTQALELLDKSQKFGEAVNLAGSTGRIALASPVATLQRIKQETENVETTGCLSPAKQDTITAMNYCIEGFMKFMKEQSSNSSHSLCDTYFTLSIRKLTDCIEDMKKAASVK